MQSRWSSKRPAETNILPSDQTVVDSNPTASANGSPGAPIIINLEHHSVKYAPQSVPDPSPMSESYGSIDTTKMQYNSYRPSVFAFNIHPSYINPFKI
jgi:hypothetical protein